MRILNSLFVVCLLCLCSPTFIFAGTSPCSATNYQLSDFGITKNYTLDNGTFTDLPDPDCGDYQGQDFWVMFTGPSSGLVNLELLDGSITDGAFQVYWNACNGLAANVGCFADRSCGQVDMPGANLEVIPGETYHVRIFQEGGGGGTIGFRMSDLGGTDFALGGSAQDFNSGNPTDNCVQLTTETNNQVGCAWFETPIDFSSVFEINYQLFFGDNDAGADGIAFVFHTNPNPSCTGTGMELGHVGVSPSFIVEFDTFRNGGEIAQDHAAINIDTGNPFLGTVNVAPPTPIGVNGNVEDGQYHDVTLKWNPNTNFFEVFFDGVQIINVNVALITNVFVAGQPVYWGLTGSTGGAVNDQIFCFEGFEIENSNSVETKINEKICDGGVYVFNGTPLFDAGEYPPVVFTAANGCDSTVTLTLEVVDIDITGTEEFALPCDEDADIQFDASLDANVDESTLSYFWSTDDGTIDSGENTLTPTVSSEGTYTLTVLSNPDNCQKEFVVTVSEATPPEVTAEGGFLGCGGGMMGDSLILTCHSGNGGLLVEWTTLDGSFIGNSNVPNPVVDSIGTYTVTVTDPITGCTATSSTTVSGGGGGDSGPDIFFCSREEGEIFLAGSVSDDAAGFVWEPATGLSDPFDLNAQVLDLSGPTSYLLMICNLDGPNLIENGNFANGNTGFNSDYEEGTATAGEFLVTDNPQNFNPIFDNCDDNSEDDDMMMVIDGDTSPNQNIWCQEVEVAEGSTYSLSAWFTNVCSSCTDNSPIISYTVDGVSVNTPTPINTPACNWQEMKSDFFVANGTTIEICISNLETASNGNDFAMDDIEMYSICKSGAPVECNIFPYQELDVFVDVFDVLCDPSDGVNVQGLISGTPSNDVTWVWANAFPSPSDPSSATVFSPGIQYVNVIDNVTGCETESSFEVFESEIDTEFTLSAEELSCADLSTTITIDGLDLNEVSIILWSDGASINQVLDTSFDVSEPGVYIVSVVNSDFCQVDQEITVTRNDEIPEGSIIAPETLTCFSPTANLTVDAPAGSDYTYDWSSDPTGGNSISVSAPGMYEVVVTDNQTGCTTTLTTEVFIDDAAPQYSVDFPSVIDCNNPQADLGVLGDPDLVYEWLPNSGIISGLDASFITVTSPGSYDVVVTNVVNGCSEIESINVSSDFSEPTVEAGSPLIFGCSDNALSLEGMSANNVVSVEWQTSGGIILGGGDTFTPSIGGAGAYTIIVTGDNGCTGSDSVIIESDTDLPTVSAPQSIVLNCLSPIGQIDATGSSSGADFVLEWRDENGNVISDFSTLDPTVSEAGQYQLTIFNTQNGCDASTIVNVIDDFADPIAATTSVSDLNCIDLTSTFGLELDNSAWSFTWADANGDIAGEDQFQLVASEPGNYTLTIIDQNNGCTNDYSFTLDSNAEIPVANISGLSELSCLQSEIEITAATDSDSPIFLWSTNDGNILSDENLANIEINAPGTYSVTVMDAVTGCSVMEDFVIADNADLPIIEIEDPSMITCDIDEVSLLSTVTNIGQDVEYIWTTNDGILNSPNGASSISVTSEGTYTLTVIDNENGCSSTSSVFVTESIGTFLVEIEDVGELNCDITELTLSGIVTASPGLIFTWSTDDGNITSGEETLNPMINQSGEYTLTVTDPSNGCQSMASIIVQQDSNVPELTIAAADEINCASGQVELNASGSSEGLDFLIEWTTNNGNIVSGENTLMPNVNGPGTYTLSITNVTNNCQVTQDIDVVDNSLAPQIDLLPFGAIDCGNSSVEVSANVINSAGGLSFVWTGLNGTFALTTTDPNIELSAAGDYTLEVIDQDNGCSSATSFIIEGNNDLPDVSILSPDDIDCTSNSTTVSLDMGSNSQNLTFSWSTINGTINGPDDGAEIEVTSAGTYEVIVFDPTSNCEVILSTEVETTAAVPDLAFIMPDIITCADPTTVINTQTLLNGLLYEWTTDDGTFMSLTNGEDVVVSAAGTYSLVVTNPANNCTNNINVLVEADIDLPIVSIADADDLSCSLTEQELSADGSSTGSEFSYQWTTDLGQILLGDDSLTPTINAPGLYTLEIINTESQCSQVDSIFISENSVQPLAALTTPLELDCNNEVVDLSSDLTNTDNLTLEWTTANGNIISDPAATTIQVDMPGDYTLAITDQTNGCENILMTTVEQNAVSPVLELSEGFTLNCDFTEGTLSIINSDPDAQITWLDPLMNVLSTDIDITLSEPGIYTAVALFLATGCETIQTVEVLRNENMPTDIITNVTSPLCFGDVGSITLQEVIGGEGPYLFSTDGGQSFSDLTTLDNLEAGTVTEIIAQDVNGCLLTDEIVMPDLIDIEASLPDLVELSLGESYDIRVQTNIPTADIATIVWTPDTGLSCTDCLDPTINPDRSIDYEVQITTTNGCVEFAEIQFRVDRNVRVYIPNAFSPFNDDGINDSFYIFADEDAVANVQSLQVFDRWGNQVFLNENFNANDASEGWNGEFRSERMQSGVYVYYAVVEFADGTTELLKGDFTLVN